jgi:hypothetical protein
MPLCRLSRLVAVLPCAFCGCAALSLFSTTHQHHYEASEQLQQRVESLEHRVMALEQGTGGPALSEWKPAGHVSQRAATGEQHAALPNDSTFPTQRHSLEPAAGKPAPANRTMPTKENSKQRTLPYREISSHAESAPVGKRPVSMPNVLASAPDDSDPDDDPISFDIPGFPEARLNHAVYRTYRPDPEAKTACETPGDSYGLNHVR